MITDSHKQLNVQIPKSSAGLKTQTSITQALSHHPYVNTGGLSLLPESPLCSQHDAKCQDCKYEEWNLFTVEYKIQLNQHEIVIQQLFKTQWKLPRGQTTKAKTWRIRRIGLLGCGVQKIVQAKRTLGIKGLKWRQKQARVHLRKRKKFNKAGVGRESEWKQKRPERKLMLDALQQEDFLMGFYFAHWNCKSTPNPEACRSENSSTIHWWFQNI